MLLSKTYIYLGASCALFASGWFVNDWRRDSIDYVAEQSRVAAIADARRRADEAERIAAETRATVIVKEKVVTNDIIKYFKDPNRTVCEYDAERVRIKTEILRTADPRSHAID